MEIKEEMLNALKNRKEDEFNIGDIDYIYKGIDIGNIRKKIGYRSVDISNNIKTQTYNLDLFCYKYFRSNETDVVLIYLHGGGFYGGSAEVMENCCKYLADFGDIHVFNIEYELAPEMKFPETSYKIYSTIEKIKKMYPKARFVIAGDSAGAHLSFNVCLIDKCRIIDKVFMYYPVISVFETRKFNIDDYGYTNLGPNAKSVILFLKSIMPLMQKLYLPDDTNKENEMINFLNITDFSNLPEIYVAKSQFDYFNLDIDDFCKNANIKPIEYEGVSHGFLELLGYIDEAKDLLEFTIRNIL